MVENQTMVDVGTYRKVDPCDRVNIPAQAHVGVAPVVIWLGILPVESDSLTVIVDGPLRVANVVVGVTAVEIRFGVLRVIADRQVISGDGFL